MCVRVCACSIVSFGKHSGEVLSLGGGAQGTEAPAPGRGRVPRIPIAAEEAAGRGAWLEGGRREGRPGRPGSGDGPCSEVSASAAQPVSVQVRGSARERLGRGEPALLVARPPRRPELRDRRARSQRLHYRQALTVSGSRPPAPLLPGPEPERRAP